ncbi:MAG TPA: NADH-quinone oxidoreductase subunit C [Candidatus Polarisedimenticolia bacterium]|nr:NADH-quinone oxidoreductase subunit C [Candidatus Polarisedimenticolia bacterium]
MGLIPRPEDLQPVTGVDATIVEKVKGALKDSFVADQLFRGQLSIWVEPRAVVDALRLLKSDPELLYEFLTDITAVDRLDFLLKGEPRFEVVYILFSPTFNRRLFLKTRVAEETPVPTATKVWRGANFMEREVYDMFGVKFEGHPNLTRILTPDGWLGHPLRKDFPTQSAQFPNVEN